MKEYRDLTADPLQDTITAGPVSEDNMLEWEALIQGPEGTPYVSYPSAFIDRDSIADDGRKEVCSPPSFCLYVALHTIDDAGIQDARRTDNPRTAQLT
jgi:hypothetical protein